ncbi:U-box domain-containing protein 33-like [Iris pallida]|uniref:RING-type E3 ubiquitin transferase n=1 Tax=Iris pallida TaxID=29817 RepID=A0AAX6G973_IRIPA|nr:U-box domain-containing protein 33-like [Iris pallida]
MALVSSSVAIHMRQHPQQLEATRAAAAMRGFSRMSSASLAPSLCETTELEEVEKIYVALGKEYKEGKETLIWAINHTPREKKIVVVHVHQPPRTILILGGKFSVDHLSEEQVRAYREQERLKTDRSLEAYMTFCSLSKVRAEKLVIETDDIAKGIVELIAQHGITKLVMGAAADRQYSKRMRGPKSRIAINVQQHVADTSCTIWFVCKGNLICSRDASLDESRTARTPAAIISTRKSTQSEPAGPTSSSLHQSSSSTYNDQEATSTPRLELEEIGIDDDIYQKLQQALKEAEDSEREAYNLLESVRRQKAKIDAELKAKETKGKQIFEEVKNANKKKQELELKIASSEQVVKDLAEKLSGSRAILMSLREENTKLQGERDDAVRRAEELLRKRDDVDQAATSSNGRMSTNFSDFTYSELERATDNFDDSHKIGEGGYGSVYKGFLRHTEVAIKKLKPEGGQEQEEFYREVDILSQVRHPHLVALIGKCSEACAIVYEYLPQGSLEDRLVCKDGTPPLSWQARTRILTEICSALIFLHSSKPHCVVHGDIKPSNILLDSNLVSKLGDFGISCLLAQSNTNTNRLTLQPRGTFAYMDPELLNSGELTPRSDVYSFGIIILRMLTGRPAVGLIKGVTEAVEMGRLREILDVSAGDWPFAQAEQLAHLVLRCCDIQRKNRPDLAKDVWRVLEPMRRTTTTTTTASPGPVFQPSFRSTRGEGCIPSCFICPIFQDIMRDPHVTADGVTYQAISPYP